MLVVGDVMLDRYWFGDALRISPEAPVPVVLWRKEEPKAGGAANVAANCAALGAGTTLLSVVGNDAEGATLRSLLEKSRVKVKFHQDPSIRTTQKLRIISQRQQLLRIDFETPPSREVLAQKFADFKAALPACGVVILSDYGKGGLAHIARMVAMAGAAGKKVLIDPKGDDWSRYRGAYLLTPNRAEFREVAGTWKTQADFERRARRLRRRLGLAALLVTLGGEGMTLFTEGKSLHVPADEREVYDVSGAGDTVIATLAVARAAGCDWAESIRLANRAAGIVVGKLGTAVVSRAELAAAA